MDWKMNQIPKEMCQANNPEKRFLAVILVIVFGMILIYYFSIDESSIFEIVVIEIIFVIFNSYVFWVKTYNLALNPKKIKWDKKGFYWINSKGKEKFIPWEKVRNIKEYNDHCHVITNTILPVKPIIIEKHFNKRIREPFEEYRTNEYLKSRYQNS